MKTTIFLVCTNTGVSRMTKGAPISLRRGEIAIKVNLEVQPGAFKGPVIEQTVVVEDWLAGIDLPDIARFTVGTITPAEAEMVRQNRIAQMRDHLMELGFKVEPPTRASMDGEYEPEP